MASANPLPDVMPETDTEAQTRRQPPYAVILHNDDINTMEFVVAVLRKVFGYTVEKCVGLMLEAHEKGKAVVVDHEPDVGFGRRLWIQMLAPFTPEELL